MATIKHVQGIYPSNSGNTRVMIVFKDRGDLHFYMKPDGSLHFPSQHDEHTLADPYDGYQEYDWVFKTWRRTNKAVKSEELAGEKRKQAVALCLKLIDPVKRREAIRLALIAKSGRVQLGGNGELKKQFNKIKKSIRTENKATPPPAVKPSQPQKEETKTNQASTNDETEQKVNPSYYGGSQIDKFHQRYAKKAM